MPKGIPRAFSAADAVAPISVKRLENVPLARVGIFRSKQQREDRNTKEKYEVDAVKLSLDFDSGHIQCNVDGDPLLDSNGNEQPHYINEGFVTYTGDARGTLPSILKALGFDGPDFIEQDGSNANGLRGDLDVVMEFGTNGLGVDYAGVDFEELPEYVLPSKGGTEKKRNVEVPVISWTINDIPVIGRHLDLALEIRNGYNKVSTYIQPHEVDPLTTINEEGDNALGMTADTAPAKESPSEPVPTEKGPLYVWKLMEDLQVPVEQRTPIMRAFTADPSIKNIASLSVIYSRMLRDAYKEDATIIKRLHDKIAGQPNDDFDEDEEEF